jgi:hypothetical protein
MIIELREEFFLARHQCLEKAQHAGDPLSDSCLLWRHAGVKRAGPRGNFSMISKR